MARHSFFCIDGHTCGNPVRLVAGGGPLLDGATMMERRAHFLAEYDWIRTGLMFEPRGHDVMSGSILYPPTRDDCDIAILFIETSGCLPMCGHGTIGTVTMAIEHGLVKPKTPGVLRLDTPAGLVVAEYRQDGEYVEEVRITNVPSFLYAEGLTVECPGLGEIRVDVAYGGNFYAIVEPQENYPRHGRPFGRRSDRLEPGGAPAAQREIQLRASRESRRSTGSRTCCGPARRRSRRRRCAQRRVLRRQGDRPLALRHRHLGAHGAAPRQGQAEGRRRLRARIDHRLAVQRPRREARRRSPASRPSSPRSAAGRA